MKKISTNQSLKAMKTDIKIEFQAEKQLKVFLMKKLSIHKKRVLYHKKY